MREESHKRQVLEYLKKHGSITPMDALREFGCYRLGARIYDLRHDRRNPVKIRTDIEERYSNPGIIRRMKGEKQELTRFARYSLES